MSWFESIEQAFDIDITSIQDTISTGLQETTKLGNIGEFLNLDALAEQQEKDDDDDDDEDDNANESYDDNDNDEFISININNKKIINDNKITSTNTTNTTTATTTPIKKKTSRSNDDDNEDTLSPAWDWTPAKSNNINDNKDITNSAQSDRLSVVDLDNSPNKTTTNTTNNTTNTTTTTTTIIKKDDDNNNIKNDNKIINNTLKINKKTTNNNTESNKRIEVYASEYVGKVKKPKAKKKTKKDGLDFFGLSSASSIASSTVTTNAINDGVIYDEEKTALINIHDGRSNDENDINSNGKDIIDDNETSSYSIAIDAIMKSIPQRLTESSSYYSQVEKVFSFFDNDEEIDLTNDPILKQVKENKEKGPSLFREYSSALAVFDGVSVYNSPLVSPMKDNNKNNNDVENGNDNQNNDGGGIKEMVIWIQSLQSEIIIMINECREGGNIKDIMMKIFGCSYYCIKSISSLIVTFILFTTRMIIKLFSYLSKLKGRRQN